MTEWGRRLLTWPVAAVTFSAGFVLCCLSYLRHERPGPPPGSGEVREHTVPEDDR